MNKIALLFMVLALPAFAVEGLPIDTSVNNLSATYNTSFPQLTLTGFHYKVHLKVANATLQWICCDTENFSTTVAPTAGNGHEVCVAPSSTESWDTINMLTNVYCRTIGSTLTTGIWAISAW